MTKMLISEAIKWWFRQAEKLPDGSAKIFEKDNNRLSEEIAKLERQMKRLTEMTKGMRYAEFLWKEMGDGNITEEEYQAKLDHLEGE